MIQQPAARKYDADQYGTSGYRYYLMGDINSAFRTDYMPDLKFKPSEDAQELTLLEWLEWKLKGMRAGPSSEPKPVYYYWNFNNDVWKQETPTDPTVWGAVELMPGEYIALSLHFDINHEDTLL